MSAFPETPFGSADRIELASLPLAVVSRERITIADLREAFDVGYAALGKAAAEGALSPAGPAVAVYRGDPAGVFDLEIGFPVSPALEAELDSDTGAGIRPSALPHGAAFATTHFGGYDELGSAWGELVARAAADGVGPAGIWIEVYVSDPRDTAAEKLRTDLIMPVRA